MYKGGTMKAARYHLGERGVLQIDEIPEPSLNDGEVLIKVAFCGICGSDLIRYRQLPAPTQSMRDLLGPISPVPGHEISGVIDRVGSGVPEQWQDGTPVVGSRVVAHPLLACGQCPACQQGKWGQCAVPEKVKLIGLHLDGGFAEQVKVPFDHVVQIKNQELSLKLATFTEPTAVAIHAINLLANLDLDLPICVIGDGTIGLLTAYMLESTGYKEVLLVGHHHDRLTIAEKLGVDNRRIASEIDISDLSKFKYVIQAAGSQEALELGINLLSQGGGMICLGYLHETDNGVHPDLFTELIRYEKFLKGSYCYTLGEFSQALDEISQMNIDFSPILSAVVPQDEIVESGFEKLVGADKLPGKVLVSMG
jgi:threonine dehydrogenase-like Zn-dependent dehydrogenase